VRARSPTGSACDRRVETTDEPDGVGASDCDRCRNLASAGCQTVGGDRNSSVPQQYDDFRSDFRGDMRYPGPGLTGGGGG
jgi:hypothetical protein